jgi:hypothetical protein
MLKTAQIMQKLFISPNNYRMKQLTYSMLALITVTLTSCEVIGGIFKAGVWTGIIAVAIVIGLIIFLVTRGRK